MILELSRPIPAHRVGGLGLSIKVEASAPECAAIARRLLVPAVQALQCNWSLRPEPGGCIQAEGRLHAALEQVCVVSLDPFPVEMEELFTVRFVPPGKETEAADDPDEPDELVIENGVLELGEATVEQLALSLDPYPRKPGAELPEDEMLNASNPFAALANLRKPQ